MSPKQKAPDTQQETPERIARDWLGLIDAGKVRESWAAAATPFRAAVDAQDWASKTAAVRTPLGAVVSRRLLSERRTSEVPGAPDGEYVILEFATTFDRKRSAVETVTPMLDTDGKWHVAGYYIR